MKKILVPVFNNRISSRLDCAESFQIIIVNKVKVQQSDLVKVYTKNQLEKLRQLISIQPDTIICNGVTDFFKDELIKNKIELIPWVYGQINEVIDNYMNGTLAIHEQQEVKMLRRQ